jgi:hypothetical protein
MIQSNPPVFRFLFPAFLIFIGIFTFYGCETDPCEGVNCLNGGSCLDGNCECPDGFEGEFCQLAANQKFLGNYTVSYDCFSAVHTASVAAVASDPLKVEIINLGDYACPDPMANEVRLLANVNGNMLEIPTQTACAGGGFGGYTFAGNGAISGTTLTISFQAVYDGGGFIISDSCIAVWERQ